MLRGYGKGIFNKNKVNCDMYIIQSENYALHEVKMICFGDVIKKFVVKSP